MTEKSLHCDAGLDCSISTLASAWRRSAAFLSGRTSGLDVVVSGRSHVPKIDTVGGVLYLNPGSAGRRRFKLPITLATLEITPDSLRPVIHDLERD